MKHAITATLFNRSSHFSVSLPMFFQYLGKDVRDDLIEHFKSYSGSWNPVIKMWDFPPSSKIAIFKLLQAFNVKITAPPMSEQEAAEKERSRLLLEPRKIIVQVPVDLSGPNNPAIRQVLERQYAKLEEEFRKLHMQTGVCKTKMREILQKCVPAMGGLIATLPQKGVLTRAAG